MSATTYDLATVLRHAVETRLACVHTVLAAVVETYDAATCTITATPVTSRPVLCEDGSYAEIPMPTFSDVPVLFPAAGGYRMAWPLTAGDGVLLMFPMVSPGPYLSTGKVGIEAGVGELHGPGVCFALPGVVPTDDVIAGPTGTMTIGATGTYVSISPSEICLGATVGAGYVALAAAVETAFTGIKNSLTAAVCAAPGSPLSFPVPLPTTSGLGATKVKAL